MAHSLWIKEEDANTLSLQFRVRMWRLSLRDMTSSLRVLPAVRIAYLAYVQMRLIQSLTGCPTDEQYCEVRGVLT